jgi:serine/threonine protein kinase
VPDPEPGDRIGPYRIEARVGEGGAGVVYRAVREPDGASVALKVLRAAMARDPVLLRRFEHELRAARAIRHPHLVAVLDSGTIGEQPYIVSRFMAGGSLATRIRDRGPLPPAEAVTVISQVGAGLDALHAAGIVHRDVTAGNVLLESDGTAALADFGLAKGPRDTVLTRAGRALGTLDVLAPELIRGSQATPASDVYALGCVAYAAIRGAPPFAGRGPMQVAFGHLSEIPSDPVVANVVAPPGLGAAVLAALAKDPGERPASAGLYGQLLVGAIAAC